VAGASGLLRRGWQEEKICYPESSYSIASCTCRLPRFDHEVVLPGLLILKTQAVLSTNDPIFHLLRRSQARARNGQSFIIRARESLSKLEGNSHTQAAPENYSRFLFFLYIFTSDYIFRGAFMDLEPMALLIELLYFCQCSAVMVCFGHGAR
jgi:hypothetical protein